MESPRIIIISQRSTASSALERHKDMALANNLVALAGRQGSPKAPNLHSAPHKHARVDATLRLIVASAHISALVA